VVGWNRTAQKETAGESEGRNIMQWRITTQKHMKNENKIKSTKGGRKARRIIGREIGVWCSKRRRQ
jgi:hypothetical protein